MGSLRIESLPFRKAKEVFSVVLVFFGDDIGDFQRRVNRIIRDWQMIHLEIAGLTRWSALQAERGAERKE